MVSHLFVQVENPARANTPETKRLVRSHISSLQHERNRHLYCRHPPRRKKPLNHVRDVHDQASDQSEPSKLPLLVNDDIVCNLGHVTVSHHNKQSQAYRTVRNGPVLALHLSPKDPTDELAKLIMGTGISFSSICRFQAYMATFMGPDCDSTHLLPKGTLQYHIMNGFRHHLAARAAILLCCVGAVRQAREQSLWDACVLNLRGYVIRCVQTTIDDDNTRTSDYAALAVASVGIFERSYGFVENHEIHTHAVQNMQVARGGSMGWMLDRVLLWMGNLGNKKITGYTYAARNDSPEQVDVL